MNRVLKVLVPVFVVATIATLAQPVLADFILNPTAYDWSSYYSDSATVHRAPANTTDGRDLSDLGASVTTGSSVPSTWPTGYYGSGYMWLTGSTSPGNGTTGTVGGGFGTSNPAFVTYTLPTYGGATNYDLTGIYVWNYNENGQQSRGADAISIQVADTLAHAQAGQWTTATVTGGTGGSNTFDEATSTSTDPGKLYGLTAADVAVVKIGITSSYGATSGTFVGLAQVRFVGSPVPEPSALVLFGTGLVGLLAYAWRKRK